MLTDPGSAESCRYLFSSGLQGSVPPGSGPLMSPRRVSVLQSPCFVVLLFQEDAAAARGLTPSGVQDPVTAVKTRPSDPEKTESSSE